MGLPLATPLRNQPGISIFIPLVFKTIQTPLPANRLFSHPYKTPGVWGSARRASTPHRASPYVAITYIQPLQFHAITHSFAQRRHAIPPIFNWFRTLSIATGVVPPKAVNACQVPFFRIRTRRSGRPIFRISTVFRHKEVTATNTAACYSKHLWCSTSFRLSSTRRLPARVPHPRCDPQHLSTCGRLGDEITGCFSKTSGLTFLFPAPRKSHLLFSAPLHPARALG